MQELETREYMVEDFSLDFWVLLTILRIGVKSLAAGHVAERIQVLFLIHGKEL